MKIRKTLFALTAIALLLVAGCASNPAAPVSVATTPAVAATAAAHPLAEQREELLPFFVHHARNGECAELIVGLDLGIPVDTVDAVDQTALIAAAGKNQIECARVLLDRGADPNRCDPAGWTALIHATYFGASEDLLKLLIARGAQVNEQNDRGVTALYLAAASGKEALVRLLLASGADPGLANKAGYTALRVAQTKGLTQIAALLEQPAAAPKP